MMTAETLPKPPPKQARAAAKREAILDAAEALLNDHTPDAITTRSLAKAAGIPVGSLYRYFANIDDLLQALFSRMNAGTVDLLQQQLDEDQTDWRDQVYATFEHLKHMHLSHPAYGTLQAHLERSDEDDIIAQLLQELLIREVPKGQPDKIRAIVLTVTAIIEGVERRIADLSPNQKNAALDEAKIAVLSYLDHYLPTVS